MSDFPIVKPEVEFAEDLLDQIKVGKLRLPPFQRPFVWKPENMRDLFDSIYKGYPIGSLLLWESATDVESLDKVGPLPVDNPNSKPLSYILDGQQRLATLFGCLRIPADYPQEKEEDWRWWIWFDLENKQFVHAKHNKPELWYLPLRATLSTLDFLNWSRKIIEESGDKANKWIEDAEIISKKLKSFKVAVIRIQGGTSDQAVEIFSRLNTKGQSMTPDQMVSALTYGNRGKGNTLADLIDEILENLADYKFGDISRMTVFRAIVSASGKEIHKSEWETLAKGLEQGLDKAVESAKASLVRAVQFLYERLEVPGDRFLPYANQLLLLSHFFHHCPTPDEQQITILRKWFWVTSLSDWLASANTTEINKALNEMRSLAEDGATRLQVIPLDHPIRPFPDQYDLRSARVRALLIFMFSLKPLSPLTGEPVSPDVIQMDMQEKRGLPYVFSRLTRSEGGSAPANRILLDRIRGQSMKNRLLSIREDIQEKILASHAIPQQAFDALKADNAEEFIKARTQEIRQRETAFMRQLGITPPSGEELGEAVVDTE